MNLIRFVIYFTISLFLTGCYPKALIPEDFHWKEKLYGYVKNGTYTAAIGSVPGRGFFRVEIPQNRNRDERLFLKPHEFFGLDYTYITFGPVASDRTIYRAFVSLRYNQPLWYYRARRFPVWAEMVERGYYRQMDKIFEERTFVFGHPAIYQVYLQRVAGYYNYIGMHQPGEVTFTHAIYTIDYGRYGVILWIQSSSGSGLDLVNDINRYQVLDQTWVPQMRWVRSFMLYPQMGGIDCKRPLCPSQHR